MLVDYVRKKYKLTESIQLSFKKEARVQDTCFRELVFEGRSAFKTWELKLYGSPDGRFMSTDLFDTTIDPAVEQQEKDQVVLRGLIQNANATRGPQDATVTIVEFADFECASCRNFAGVLDEVMSRSHGDVRLVFHHMPLANHRWARAAAEAAACAQLQSSRAFWGLHDKIFANQGAITAENAKDTFKRLAESTDGLDVGEFQKCIDGAISLGLVLKDLDLAERNRVNATPTVFINGRRVEGLDSPAKLETVLEQTRNGSRQVGLGTKGTEDSPKNLRPSFPR